MLGFFYSLRKQRYTEKCRAPRSLRGRPYTRANYGVCCEKLLGRCYGRTMDLCTQETVSYALQAALECAKRYAAFEWS